MARLTGLEPATPGVTGRYSNRLSYNRASFPAIFLKVVARLTGLEPATPGVTGRYSNQLSYNRADHFPGSPSGVRGGLRRPAHPVKGDLAETGRKATGRPNGRPSPQPSRRRAYLRTLFSSKSGSACNSSLV